MADLNVIAAAQGGDSQAKNQVFEENVGLIHMIVKRFGNRGYSSEELFQIGAVGLLKAIMNFDSTTGYAFSTYAVPKIIGEIKLFLRDDNMMHISRKVKEDARKIAIVREEYEKTNNKSITIKEIEQLTGLNEDEIVLAQDAYIPIKSIDEPTAIRDNKTNGKSESEKVIDNITICQLLSDLPEMERMLIKYRYVDELTQTQTAKLMGINQVKVSRLERQILHKMRKKIII